MAYADAYLTCIGQAGPYNHSWAYETADAAATVDDSGYFTGNAAVKLKVGDLIFRRTWSAAPPVTSAYTLSTFGWHAVVSNDGTTVDTTDATAGTMTNTN